MPESLFKSYGSRSLTVGILAVLLVMLAVLGAAPSEGGVEDSLRQLVQTHIRDGKQELENGFYGEAGKKFLMAQSYQEYLPPAAQKELLGLIKKAQAGSLRRGRVEEALRAANEFIKENDLEQAKARLEEILDKNIGIASPNWLVIGRQVHSDHGQTIDLLAIDRDANLVVLELKRDKTYRDIVAQVLDYGSWVRELKDERIAQIFDEYQNRWHNKGEPISIDEAFKKKFGVAVPDDMNSTHELVIVASGLDPATERIVRYLADEYGIGSWNCLLIDARHLPSRLLLYTVNQYFTLE